MRAHRPGAILVLWTAASIVTACATAPAEPVASEAQAVRIAKERCEWTRPFTKDERWQAREHQGQWHVWLVRDRDPREPVVGALDIWIRASDGRAGDCNHA